MKHGQGKMQYADGTVYEGAWEDNRHHGLGQLKYRVGPDHFQQTGLFHHGKFQSEQEFTPRQNYSASDLEKLSFERKPLTSDDLIARHNVLLPKLNFNAYRAISPQRKLIAGLKRRDSSKSRNIENFFKLLTPKSAEKLQRKLEEIKF